MAKDRIESKYVTVAPGVELHILEKGEGKPLVFIPGLTFSGEIFKNQLEYFSSEYNVISAACGSFRRRIFCVISGSRNDLKHWVMLLPPSAASVSERFAECFLHLFFCFIRHVDQSESIEHSVYIGHTPDIAQRFRTFNYLSYLFNIAQSQQHGTPRQTFTILSAIDPQFLGEFISPALFQRIAFVSFASNNKFSNSSRIAFNLFGFIT